VPHTHVNRRRIASSYVTENYEREDTPSPIICDLRNTVLDVP
jgi:hypothetical protein